MNLRSTFACSLIAALLPLAASAASPGNVVQTPAGPVTSSAPSDAQSKGSLLVYSAFDAGAPVPGEHGYPHYSSYTLKSTDGKVLQEIKKNAGASLEEPLMVGLAPGIYRVEALANGFGVVTIPVEIVAGRPTILHLEGGASWPASSQRGKENAIRLPDGRTVGWRG